MIKIISKKQNIGASIAEFYSNISQISIDISNNFIKPQLKLCSSAEFAKKSLKIKPNILII